MASQLAKRPLNVIPGGGESNVKLAGHLPRAAALREQTQRGNLSRGETHRRLIGQTVSQMGHRLLPAQFAQPRHDLTTESFRLLSPINIPQQVYRQRRRPPPHPRDENRNAQPFPLTARRGRVKIKSRDRSRLACDFQYRAIRPAHSIAVVILAHEDLFAGA